MRVLLDFNALSYQNSTKVCLGHKCPKHHKSPQLSHIICYGYFFIKSLKTKYMSKEKIIKTRKKHTCEICNKTIKKRSIAVYLERKLPKFDNKTASYDHEGNQIGIEYKKFYFHKKCSDDAESEKLFHECPNCNNRCNCNNQPCLCCN